jgi:hypothetical protein
MPDISNEVLQPTGLTPSDAPVVESVAGVETVAADAPQGDVPKLPDESASGNVENGQPSQGDEVLAAELGEEPKRPPKGVGKFIANLREENRQANDRAARAEAVASMLMQQQQRPPQQVAPPQDAPPNPLKFDTWEEGQRAIAEWSATRAARAENAQFLNALVTAAQRTQAMQAQQYQEAQIDQRIGQSVEKQAKAFGDWNDLREKAMEMPVSPAMRQAIAESDNPAAVMHFLAKNDQAHAQLLLSSPQEVFRRVGRIEASLSTPAISSAPPPAKPVGNRGPSIANYTETMTPEQHKAFLAKSGQTRGIR